MILKSRGGCCWYLHSAEEESKAEEGDARRWVPRRVPRCHDLKNASHNQEAADEREASWCECSPAGKGFWGSDLHITLWGCCDRGPLSHTMGQKPFQGVLLGQRA